MSIFYTKLKKKIFFQTSHLHGCPLIGDNFFYTFAKIDLSFPLTKTEEGYFQCGQCTNGLTIKKAQMKVNQEIETGKIIIVNIGSTDILNGRQLIQMMEDMICFLETCKKKEITPILTTLAPLPTYFLGNRSDTLLSFNKFLKINPYKFPVIDLHKLFVTKEGRVNFHTFQVIPRHAHGSKNKILMWNRYGRKRVLNQITEEIGTHILNIFFEHHTSPEQQLNWHQTQNC